MTRKPIFSNTPQISEINWVIRWRCPSSGRKAGIVISTDSLASPEPRPRNFSFSPRREIIRFLRALTCLPNSARSLFSRVGMEPVSSAINPFLPRYLRRNSSRSAAEFIPSVSDSKFLYRLAISRSDIMLLAELKLCFSSLNSAPPE